MPGNSKVANKRKASAPETDVEILESPAPNTLKMSKARHEAGRAPLPHEMKRLRQEMQRAMHRAPRKKVTSKEFVSEDGVEVPAGKVIHIKRKQPEAGTSSKPAIEQPTKSLETELHDSTAKEDDSGAEKSSLRLFGVQCERCIRDDFTCVVVLGKKKGEVRKSCQHCEVKKKKCVRPSPEREHELRAAFIQKKNKAAAASETKTRVMQKGHARAPPQSRTNARSGTGSVSRKRLPSAPVQASDEDVEGEGDTEIAPDARPEQGIGSTSGDGEIEIEKQEAETSAGEISEHGAIVDNDVNMDFDVAAAVVETQASPEAAMAELPPPSTPQPSALDIFQSIQALGKKFDALPQTSGDCAEALHQQMKSRVNALDQRWEGRFATIEAKVRDVEMRSSVNAVSLGHTGNAIHAFNQTGKLPAFDPPAGQSLGHPYGQLPVSCLPHVGNASQEEDPSVSAIGRRLTTAWDESRAPVVSAPGNVSASAVQPSGDAPRLSQSSQLSSAPSGSITENE